MERLVAHFARPLTGPLAFAALAFLATACGGPKQYELLGTPTAPGTDGIIQLEEVEGNNHLLTITLRNLVPPRRLDGNLRSYAVWLQVPGQAIRAGNLEYNDKSRQGTLVATTPYTKFTLLITAERSDTPNRPGNTIVIEQKISL